MRRAGTENRRRATADPDAERNERDRIQPRSVSAEPFADRRRTSAHVSVSRHSARRCRENQEAARSLPRSGCVETACRHGTQLG